MLKRLLRGVTFAAVGLVMVPSWPISSQALSPGPRIEFIQGHDRPIPTVIRTAAVLESRALAGSSLTNGDFGSGLSGWTVENSAGGSSPGSATVIDDQAQLLEGDSFLVGLSQGFGTAAGDAGLAFDLILSPGFDLSDSFVPDAFEATLLDAVSGTPVVPTWDSLATSFFNLQEDGTPNLAPGVQWNGGRVIVDLGGVAEATSVVLFFDLIGADLDIGGGLRIDNVATCSFADPDGDGITDCAVDNCPDVHNSDQADLDGDGLGDPCDPCTDGDGDGYGGTGDPGCPGGAIEDCDDGDPTVFPGNSELCDGVDNDCNGLTDDGNPDGGASCGTGGVGVCALGTEICQFGGLVCIPDRGPGCEICGNSEDDDCDGTVDETTDDLDSDGVLNCDDNCCDVFNPGQEDIDENGVGDACDCSAFGDIGDSLRVDSTGVTEIGWSSVPGINEFNVYRGYLITGDSLTYTHQCLAANITGTVAQDLDDPLSSALFYYLVATKCAVGDVEGSLGTDSLGIERPDVFECPDPTTDLDGDGVAEALDNCAGIANPSQSDVDFDSRGDVCDNCVIDPNTTQEDLDVDGQGDVCDPDDDGDGVDEDGDGSGTAGDMPCPDMVTSGCDDNCPVTANPAQEDTDGDGLGDACDE